jgi:hypothetical protein
MKPIYEAIFELSGETKNYFTFVSLNKQNPPDFHPTKIYLAKGHCKDLKSKTVKLSISEKEK